MTPEVHSVDEQASFKEIAATMADHRVSALPVLDEEGRVAGIVSEADLLLKEEFPEGPAGGHLFQGRRQRVERAKAAGATAAELMTAPAVTVGPDATVTEAARLLHRHGIKRVPVIDRPARCSASSAAPTCSRSFSAPMTRLPRRSARRCSCGPCG
jgi:CBS domain-containing protein